MFHKSLNDVTSLERVVDFLLPRNLNHLGTQVDPNEGFAHVSENIAGKSCPAPAINCSLEDVARAALVGHRVVERLSQPTEGVIVKLSHERVLEFDGVRVEERPDVSWISQTERRVCSDDRKRGHSIPMTWIMLECSVKGIRSEHLTWLVRTQARGAQLDLIVNFSNTVLFEHAGHKVQPHSIVQLAESMSHPTSTSQLRWVGGFPALQQFNRLAVCLKRLLVLPQMVTRLFDVRKDGRHVCVAWPVFGIDLRRHLEVYDRLP
mmetsp:Transcript_20497/g.46329  ORF Transcript_20497/g.46329 Transcript_20497/m.46329 type:complete len:263 (+) Transcript_20497:415-1203(+)